MQYGLNEQTINHIKSVLARHHAVEKAILYGSRAMGTFKAGSDIDLALCGGTLTDAELGCIEMELDDLLLPYQFDLSLLAAIDNADLADHISRVGQDFFVRRDMVCP